MLNDGTDIVYLYMLIMFEWKKANRNVQSDYKPERERGYDFQLSPFVCGVWTVEKGLMLIFFDND